MIYKCKNCSGNVVYSPEQHEMVCPYCDSVNSHERKDYEGAILTICPNCNGEIEVKEHTSATQCPYCDNYLIFNERVEGEYTPQMIIPFKLGKEKCKEVIREKFKKFFFAPTDFLSEARLNSMQGTYVPYWFYDYDTNCTFEGEGTKVRSWTTGDIRYTETSYYAIRRDMNIDFRKIPVDASEEMPDDIMDLMEPFSYEQMEDFKPEYLSGFYGEKYNMTSDALESRVKDKMNGDVTQMMKESYSGYAAVKTLSQNIHIKHNEAHYGLLPVWKYIYKYKGKEYPFYVNGQTGKIVGIPPISSQKVWAYAGTVGASLMVALALFNGIMRFL